MEVNTGKTEPALAQSYTQFFNSTLFTRCTDIAGCDNTGKALEAPRSVTISPDGASVYVASGVSEAVAVFDHAANGTLTQAEQ